ncbi:hypothetical protein [Nocardia sp. X0981]
MPAQEYNGFFNHYDDPDEFWDEEPLVPITPTAQPRTPPAAPSKPPVQTPPFGSRSDTSEPPRTGSPFVSMEVDRGFLPTRISIGAGWVHQVAPHEAGDELMRAYHKAAADRLQRVYSSGRWPTPQEVFESAVPDRRTIMMMLLETATWDEYSSLQRTIVKDAVLDVFGKVALNGERPVSLTADRHYVLSIRIGSWWAAAVDPYAIVDEVLWCANEIRSIRARFVPDHNYSSYSDEDLEYQLKRHREQLIGEGTRRRV